MLSWSKFQMICGFLLCARLSVEVCRKQSAVLLQSDGSSNSLYRESLSVVKSS